MPFVFIQFLPTRPSLGLLLFSDQQVLDSPPSQLAVGNCMHSEWHLYIGKISVPPLQKSCATLAKQQAMATNESADTKIYGRVCLTWTCRAGHTGSFAVGLNQVFLL